MTEKQQLSVLKKVQKWIESRISSEDISYRTGEDGLSYSQYASAKYPFISFEGELYSLLNYGEDGWKFKEEFDTFLSKLGFYYELGEAWNLTLYKI